MAYEVLINREDTTIRGYWSGPNGEKPVTYVFRPPVPFPKKQTKIGSLGEMAAITVLGPDAGIDIPLAAIAMDEKISAGDPSPGEITIRVNEIIEDTPYSVSLR